MKDYLVTMDNADWSDIFIVSVENAKGAINMVFEKYFRRQNVALQKENKDIGEPIDHIYTKSDLKAKSIDSLYNRDEKIILVH